MTTVSENLYLLEVLVDNVTVASNDDPDIAVQVQFGDVGKFLIQRTTANSADPTDVDIADGKCLLFSMRPRKLQNYMELHALHLSVLKMTTGEIQCVAKFPWDDSFLKMVNEPAPTEPNAQFDTLDLTDPANKERFVGFIDVLVRLSCHGKNIMSQFQRRLENGKEKTVVVKPEGVYHSDVSSLMPVISTAEVSEGLVIGMLPTDNPVTCLKERVKKPSPEISEYFHPREVLYEINQHLKSEKPQASMNFILPKAPLRPCIKSFIPVDSKIQKFLASDPQGFHPYAKQQAMKAYEQQMNKHHIYDPLDHVEELTEKAMTSKQDGQGEFEKPSQEIFGAKYAANETTLEQICKNCGGYGPVNEEKQVFMALGRPTLPASHFVCQGGGCKEYIKRRRAECLKATSCSEGVPCVPVPPCMEFNPCEYPKCLKGRPRGYTPCYLPPCPADRICRPCNQSPWMIKRARKKRSAPLSHSLIKEEASKEAESEGEQPKETLNDDGDASPTISATKKKSKRRRRKKCVGTCLSRGLDRYYNPRIRQGHIACVPELIAPQGVPPNMGWLWNVPNPGINPRPGWRPGAVHKKVYEIMCRFKNTNYVDSDELRTDFETKKRNEEKAREKRRPVPVHMAQIEEPYVELRMDKHSSFKMAGAGKLADQEPGILLDAEEMKRREYLLRKTLTEVCRELCTNAYTDLYLRGRNVDLNRIPNDRRKVNLDPNKIIDALEGKTAVKPNPVGAYVQLPKTASVKENRSKLSNNGSDSLKSKPSQRANNFKKKNQFRFQAYKKKPSDRNIISDQQKQNKQGPEAPERDKQPENQFIQKKIAPLISDPFHEVVPIQEPMENLCICDYEQVLDEVQPCEDFPRICEIKPFEINFKELLSNAATNDVNANITRKAQPEVPDTVAGTDKTSCVGKKHHCRLKITTEAQLFSEIDRILRIKEEAEACKLLLRTYIQDIDIAKLAREKKFGKTEPKPITASEMKPEKQPEIKLEKQPQRQPDRQLEKQPQDTDEKIERELFTVLANPGEEIVQNTVVSHFATGQNQFPEVSVKEIQKPSFTNRIPVQAKVTTWLHKTNKATSPFVSGKDSWTKRKPFTNKRVTIQNIKKASDQQLDKKNTIFKPKENQ